MDQEPSRGYQTRLDGSENLPKEDAVQIEGTVDRIIYENADNGFLVGRLSPAEGGPAIPFVGSMLAVSPGDTMRFWGRWEENPKFGPQFRVERFETIVPNTVEGIERYLASGLVAGIGKKYAHKIVEAFGPETFKVIEESPERLREVPGIGPKRAARIREAWEMQRAVQSIMVFLQGHGIPVGQAVRIYKRYGDKAITVLRDNPYRLVNDIAGISFKTADSIATELGVPHDSPQRIEAGFRFVLERAASLGHMFLPTAEIQNEAQDLLEVSEDAVKYALVSAIENRVVIRDGDAVCLPTLHAAENGIAALLRKLLAAAPTPVRIDREKAIAWVERTTKIALSDEQRQAIRTACSSKVMVITGGPGTGKTTVLRGLLSIFSAKQLTIQLAAPTGRAAKRMEATTGREAKTIHRLLEFSPKIGAFTRNEDNPLDTDLIVIDECSMVDAVLMHQTLRAVPANARLILVGDVDQLPPVGPGNVLFDILTSQTIPAVWLKTVFRQAAESGIVLNAHRINSGQSIVPNTEDFFVIERTDGEMARDTVLELVTERIPKKFGHDPKTDIQVLAPMHKGPAGVAALNEALQKALNPDVERLPRRPFGKGDKVMQQRNNYELDVYNGDVGVVTKVDEDMQEVEVRFDDRAAIYPYDTLDELELAYAGTIHKAQGSEYPVVVMPLVMQHYIMLQRNILYTAITRATRMVVIVGDPKALNTAIANTRVTRRYTRLNELLRPSVDQEHMAENDEGRAPTKDTRPES